MLVLILIVLWCVSVLQARFAEGSDAASASAASAQGGASAEEELAAALAAGGDPVEALRASLEAERGRRRHAEAEAQRLRVGTAEQLERIRKGAERSMRELQGQVARLQRDMFTASIHASPIHT